MATKKKAAKKKAAKKAAKKATKQRFANAKAPPAKKAAKTRARAAKKFGGLFARTAPKRLRPHLPGGLLNNSDG